jgi:hypothetical protein
VRLNPGTWAPRRAQEVLQSYPEELVDDAIVHSHLTALYGTLLEQNLVRRGALAQGLGLGRACEGPVRKAPGAWAGWRGAPAKAPGVVFGVGGVECGAAQLL